LGSKEDELTKFCFTEELYDILQGPKKLFIFSGNHAAVIPDETIEEVLREIKNYLLKD